MRRRTLRLLAALFITTGSFHAAAADSNVGAATCPGKTTIEINECLEQQAQRAQARLDKYVKAASERYAEDQPAVRLGIDASEQAFEAYREIECATVYENWKDGTIRVAAQLGCMTEMADQRTYTVWRNWLQFEDSTPPILPEPTPTKSAR